MSKATENIAKLAQVAADGSNLTPVGTVGYFPAATPPAGWLKANGALVSRTTYAALFAAIGTTYGAGDGSTTFALPDLRGEFVRGLDDGRGVDAGRGLGTAQADAFRAHTHTVRMGAGQVNNYAGEFATTNNFVDTANSGSTGGSETRPRNVALLACVKT